MEIEKLLIGIKEKEKTKTAKKLDGTRMSFVNNYGYFVLSLDEADSNYIRIIYPGFLTVKGGDEVLILAYKATEKMKSSKVIIKEGKAHVSLEMFVSNENCFLDVYERVVNSVIHTAKFFRGEIENLDIDNEAINLLLNERQ